MVIQDNKELVRQFAEEVFNRRNVAAIDDFVAPDEVDHTLPPSLPSNIAGTKRATEMFLKAFPDLHVTIDDIVAEGDKVAVRFTSRGTQRAPFAGVPPTGRPVAIQSYQIARIANGKFVEVWGVDDQLGMLRQLGVIPALFGLVFVAGLGAGAGALALARRILG